MVPEGCQVRVPASTRQPQEAAHGFGVPIGVPIGVPHSQPVGSRVTSPLPSTVGWLLPWPPLCSYLFPASGDSILVQALTSLPPSTPGLVSPAPRGPAATHGMPISNRLFWMSCLPSMMMLSWMQSSIRQPPGAHCRVGRETRETGA